MPDGTPWRGFAEPEHAAKRASPQDGLRMAALAPRCAWCKRAALRGKQWCDRHRPGTASMRRSTLSKGGATLAQMRQGNADALLAASPVLAPLVAWAPVGRMLAMRPAYSRPAGGLSGLVAAAAALALGDPAPWHAALREMRRAGCLRDSDPPLTWSPSPDGGEDSEAPTQDSEAPAQDAARAEPDAPFDPFEGAP